MQFSEVNPFAEDLEPVARPAAPEQARGFHALTAALNIAFVDFRRIEREEDKAGRLWSDRVREAYDAVEQVEERIIATKAATAEDAVAQMVLGISRLNPHWRLIGRKVPSEPSRPGHSSAQSCGRRCRRPVRQ